MKYFTTVVIVFLNISGSCSGAAQCGELFWHKTDLRQRSTGIIIGKKGQQTRALREINQSNIADIFRHQYDQNQPNLFGAKAVAIYDLSGVEVWFFATGEGHRGNNVHHRDALNSLFFDHLHTIHQFLMKLIARDQDTGLHLFFHPLGEYNPTTEHAWAAKQTDSLFFDLLSANEIIKERGRNAELADSPLARYILANAQGFQLTAEKKGDKLVVTRVDVDSSITSFHQEHALPLNPEVQGALIGQTLLQIEKDLSKFKLPEIPLGLNLDPSAPKPELLPEKPTYRERRSPISLVTEYLEHIKSLVNGSQK